MRKISYAEAIKALRVEEGKTVKRNRKGQFVGGFKHSEEWKNILVKK